LNDFHDLNPSDTEKDEQIKKLVHALEESQNLNCKYQNQANEQKKVVKSQTDELEQIRKALEVALKEKKMLRSFIDSKKSKFHSTTNGNFNQQGTNQQLSTIDKKNNENYEKNENTCSDGILTEEKDTKNDNEGYAKLLEKTMNLLQTEMQQRKQIEDLFHTEQTNYNILKQNFEAEMEKRKSAEHNLYEERFLRGEVETILKNETENNKCFVEQLEQEKARLEQDIYEEKFFRQEIEIILQNKILEYEDSKQKMIQDNTSLEQATREEKFLRKEAETALRNELENETERRKQLEKKLDEKTEKVKMLKKSIRKVVDDRNFFEDKLFEENWTVVELEKQLLLQFVP